MMVKIDDLPSGASEVAKTYPDVWRSYQALGEACSKAGPIDGKTARLIKLALAIGADSEGAVHSHARRALDEGIRAEELRHVAMLAILTLGFPQAVRALTWIADITEK